MYLKRMNGIAVEALVYTNKHDNHEHENRRREFIRVKK